MSEIYSGRLPHWKQSGPVIIRNLPSIPLLSGFGWRKPMQSPEGKFGEGISPIFQETNANILKIYQKFPLSSKAI